MEELKVIDKKQFAYDIEQTVIRDGIGYLDAISDYAERNEVEIALIAELIKSNKAIRMKLLAEAEGLNMMKTKGAQLPL